MIKRLLPAFLLTGVISYLSLVNSDKIPSENWMSKIYFDKVIHISMYLMLFLAYAWGLKKVGKQNWIWIGVVLFGFVIEMLQKSMNYGRNFELFDLIANITGASLGWLVWNSKLKYNLCK